MIANVFISTNVYAETSNMLDSDMAFSDFWFEKYDFPDSSGEIRLFGNHLEGDLYSTIYDGLLNLDDEIDIKEFNMSTEQAKDIFCKVLADNRRYFI